MRRATSTLLGMLLTLLSLGAATTAAHAAPPGYLTLEATYTTVANGWDRVDRYLDTTSGFHAEQYPSDGRGDQDGQRRTFFGGVKQPYSGRFLLYSAPGWNSGSHQTPVLLVHGANDNADRAWANPGEAGGYGCGALSCPSTGLMQYLAARGYRVFAVNFAHKQGDNLMQAQQVGDAIAAIKDRLGVSQVDLVGWSKGEISTRAYVSSLRPTWGRPYAGDVRRLLTLGGPNGGYDYPYAHGWAHDFSIWPQCGGSVNAPSPHLYMTCYGTYTAHPEFAFAPTNGYDVYPGQRQMLARWDATYGIDMTQQDWYTTYHGGQGFYTSGSGIQTAIDAGSLITPSTRQASPAPSPPTSSPEDPPASSASTTRTAAPATAWSSSTVPSTAPASPTLPTPPSSPPPTTSNSAGTPPPAPRSPPGSADPATPKDGP